MSGDSIVNMALETSEAIRDLSALRIVCVEHDDNEALNNSYKNNDFKLLRTNYNEKVMRFIRI